MLPIHRKWPADAERLLLNKTRRVAEKVLSLFFRGKDAEKTNFSGGLPLITRFSWPCASWLHPAVENPLPRHPDASPRHIRTMRFSSHRFNLISSRITSCNRLQKSLYQIFVKSTFYPIWRFGFCRGKREYVNGAVSKVREAAPFGFKGDVIQ